MKTTVASLTLVMAFTGLAVAQVDPAPPQDPNPQPGQRMAVVRHGGGGPGFGHRGLGKWWKDSELMQKIGVSDEQVQKIEKIFQDHRLQLIDLHAALQKQEAILEPMIESDQPDESQVVAQIDNVAQARANLEKSNARMLLAIRRVLTVDQWKKLQTLRGTAPFHARERFGPPGRLPRGEGNFMYFQSPPSLP